MPPVGQIGVQKIRGQLKVAKAKYGAVINAIDMRRILADERFPCQMDGREKPDD
jgi:hypothetical protein